MAVDVLALTGPISSLPEHNCHQFPDIFKCIIREEEFYILIKISLKFVPKRPIDNNPALV